MTLLVFIPSLIDREGTKKGVCKIGGRQLSNLPRLLKDIEQNNQFYRDKNIEALSVKKYEQSLLLA